MAAGDYSPRHVRTIDVVPTIAAAAGATVPWRGPGHSAFDLHAPVSNRVVVFNDDRRALSIGTTGYLARTRQSLDRKIQLVGDRSVESLYAVGPFRQLLGHRLGDLTIHPQSRLSATLGNRTALNHVRLDSPYLPALVTGALRGGGARPWLPVAIAINGTIVATCRSAKLSTRPTIYVSALAPETAFHNGRNHVEAFLIEHPNRGLPTLRRLGPP